jgi:polyferredoxin
MNAKKEIDLIKARNSRVEADKAWETSKTRKIVVAVLTYLVIVVFLYSVGLPNPFVNAIVPTIGFLLSTLTLSFLKNIWVQRVYKK